MPDVVPADQDYGWPHELSRMRLDTPRCVCDAPKSIAMGRVCNAPAYRACEPYARYVPVIEDFFLRILLLDVYTYLRYILGI